MTPWKLITAEFPADAATVTIKLIWPLTSPVEATWDLATQYFTLTGTGGALPWFVVWKWKP